MSRSFTHTPAHAEATGPLDAIYADADANARAQAAAVETFNASLSHDIAAFGEAEVDLDAVAETAADEIEAVLAEQNVSAHRGVIARIMRCVLRQSSEIAKAHVTTERSRREVAEAEEQVRLAALDAERQKLEDTRANRRNRNRCLTLVVAVIFTFAVPWFVTSVLVAPQILKYSVGIAIIPDTLITLYAYYRKY